MGYFQPLALGGRNMEMLVLILAIAMVVPFPLEEIVGGYVRLLLVFCGTPSSRRHHLPRPAMPGQRGEQRRAAGMAGGS